MAKLLIVDDSMTFGEALRRHLERDGHVVVFRDSPFGITAEIRYGGYDLLVLDVKMPALDGERVAQMLAQTGWNVSTKILLCSAMEKEALQSVAARLPVDGYASKSSGLREILIQISALLGAGAVVKSGREPVSSRSGNRGSTGAGALTGAKILIVEDYASSEPMFLRRLARSGSYISVAADGVEGVAMTRLTRPDLVILDIRSFSEERVEIIRLIKGTSATSAIPIVIMLAHAAAEHRERCLSAGADEHELKPIDIDRLLGKINALLNRRA